MARLVGELLTLARLDAGDVPMERAQLDLTAMLPAWVERFQARAADSDVKLTLVMDSTPPVVGDAGRLEQVVANLIDNGIKYNHAGGRVDVRALREVTTGAGERSDRNNIAREWAVIRVSDTGPGIPKSSQSRLFERFFRADRARAAGGSGLGLAIVQEIVNAHKGYIQVQSEAGTGTTFSVWLPASR
jgi:signal transduction histidine kinase